MEGRKWRVREVRRGGGKWEEALKQLFMALV